MVTQLLQAFQASHSHKTLARNTHEGHVCDARHGETAARKSAAARPWCEMAGKKKEIPTAP
jgi:hypothetical protein